MGWIEKVRSIIDGLRKQGKSENEVEEIIQQAAEKAAVRTVEKQADGIAEAAGEAMKTMIGKLNEVGMTAERMATAFQWMGRIERRQTNNWRKMHGLPMRRKGKRR